MQLKFKLITILVLVVMSAAKGQQNTPSHTEKKEKWYEKIAVGGYMQVRYNRLLETNPDLRCEQCDESWGGKAGGFSVRRLRIKFYGQISPRVFFYFQPDFAKSIGESHHFGQLKDAYLDIGLDRDSEFRIRIGQSKVPYGFENMQSSSKRLPLDRNDALNSAVKDERDLGVFFYWAARGKRQQMHTLKDAGLKHSDDFGVFALGIYNGQTANQPDKNDNFHVVTRFSYPVEIGNQVIEPGIQAYTGKFVLPKTSPGVKVKGDLEFIDQRVAASFVLYPKPFGIQAEYTVGRGPEFNKITESITVQSLRGGYITLSFLLKKWNQTFIPFSRTQYYNGGKKHEVDARSYQVNESEIGIEWQPYKTFELVAMYTFSQRRIGDFQNQDNFQEGSLLRIQSQLNF